MHDFGPDSLVVATADSVSCDLAGDTAILHLATGVYYTLSAVGTTIWKLIQQPTPMRDIEAALLERYETDAQTCATDLAKFVNDLVRHGLASVGSHATE